MFPKPYLDLEYRPQLPTKSDYGIGCVGAGLIMNVARLPAYRKAGLHVLAITDLDLAKAEQTARKFEIPKVCASLEELLNLSSIDIVDVAVPASANPEIAKQVFGAGKHALFQKPMAETLEQAHRMADCAASARRKLAINHQMRWAPCVRAAKDLLRRGWIGEPVEYSIQI